MLAVIFRPAAQFELKAAYDWYEERESGLGSDFLRCVEGSVQLIRRHPEIFPVTHRDVRQGLVRRFPYSIFYLVKPAGIIVISIFHASRRPKQWEHS